MGYFVVDKLAGGIQLGYVRTKTKTDITIRLNSFGIGPFVRYYLLAPSSKINIVTDARIAFYESGTNLSDFKGKYRAYSGSAGPVLFLNQSVGLELLFGYTGTNDDASTLNRFRTSLGLQVHWGRR